MADLKFLTRGDSSPRNKPRVYLTAHREELESTLPLISREIFETQNCAVFYHEPGDDRMDEERQQALGRMNLFVVPVTERLLTEESCVRRELEFARKNHIPVLPVMMEPGLVGLYGKFFGNIQFLDRTSQDTTQIPYPEKLKSYLSSILVGDALSARVREAFDAYIFLSYRKKDRKYAERIMRLIHQNEACQDMAIWYDEYLVPGKQFPEVIRQAFDRSQLFALLVTPNLLEPQNYVMTTEYPMARQKATPIFPIEAVATDHRKMEGSYKALPPFADLKDEAAFQRMLTDKVRALALQRKKGSPEHDFLMGLAFLTGIDVEVDQARGVRLIRAAAEAGLPEAVEKLIAMYETGDGLERDEEAVISWQRKLVALREKECGRDPKAIPYLYLESLMVLGDKLRALGRSPEAMDAYQDLHVAASRVMLRWHNAETLRILGVAAEKLGLGAKAMGDLPTARTWFQQSLTFSQMLLKDKETDITVRDYATCLEHMGDLAWELGHKTEAVDDYIRVRDLFAQVAEASGQAQDRGCLAYICGMLSRCQLEMGSPMQAEENSRKSLELYRQLAQESQDLSNACRLSGRSCDLGDILLAQSRYEEARKAYEEALTIARKSYEKRCSVETLPQLARCLSSLGRFYLEVIKYDQALEYFEESLEISRKRDEKYPSRYAKNNLADALTDMARVKHMMKEHAAAVSFGEQALEIRRQLMETGQEPSDRRNWMAVLGNLSIVYEGAGELEKARACLQELLPDTEKRASELGTPESLRDLHTTYMGLGDISQEPDGAERWYRKSAETGERITAMSQLPSDQMLRYKGWYNDGSALLKLEKPREALEAFQKAEKALAQVPETFAGADVQRYLLLQSQGEAYLKLENWAAARENCQKARNFEISSSYRANLGDLRRSARNLQNLIAACLRMQDVDAAQKALEDICRIQDLLVQNTHLMSDALPFAQNLGALGALYRQRGETEKAETALKKALVIYDGAVERWHRPEHIELQNAARTLLNSLPKKKEGLLGKLFGKKKE